MGDNTAECMKRDSGYAYCNISTLFKIVYSAQITGIHALVNHGITERSMSIRVTLYTTVHFTTRYLLFVAELCVLSIFVVRLSLAAFGNITWAFPLSLTHFPLSFTLMQNKRECVSRCRFRRSLNMCACGACMRV